MNGTEQGAALRVKPLLVERVWGSHDLSPWYANPTGAAIGEAWLTGDACVVQNGPLTGKTLAEATGPAPLLVKVLFPREKLSVQVHPDDADAARLGNGAQAKTECWYILNADPGATVAVGLKKGTDTASVRRAIDDGSLEALLEHLPVTVGDMVYVPAGTVHAIGPGVTILEIQQNSDTTYRLYDYGRPRPLQVELGLAVLKLETAAGKVTAQAIDDGETLIRVPYFTVERYALDGGERAFIAGKAECLVALQGKGALRCGLEDMPMARGEAIMLPPKTDYTVRGDVTWVRCL